MYCYYNIRSYRDAEYQILQTNSEQYTNEFNLVLENMKFATNYVVGETELLDSLNLLVKNQNNENCPRYFKQEALLNIKKVLSRDFLTKNFYSVRIFHIDGMMLTHDSVLDIPDGDRAYVDDICRYVKTYKSGESVILAGEHADDWSTEGTVPVISIVREIIGYDGCYIEVQYSVKELEKQLALGGDIKGIIIANKNGEIIYCSVDMSEEQVESLREVKEERELEKAGWKGIAAVCRSEENEAVIITVGDKESQKERYVQIFHISIIIALFIACILFAYASLAAEILVRPVKKLQKIMEFTDYERMEQEVDFNSQIRELDDLAHSYEMLLKRLQKSMIRNKKVEQLYLQAQFDSLHSKISPHFMANILNVINSRGLELGDREICQISSSMVSLLRYSTDTGSKEIRVKKELNYLEDYCYLMKSRYLEKFLYSIQIPHNIENQVVPKLSLQQIVENAVKHGFKKNGVMQIELKGWIKGEKWYIAVRDNGQGFERDIIDSIYKKSEEMKQQILEKDNNVELALGGMGLINLYLRMYFMYDEDMVFEVKNNTLGAEVIIGGRIREGST